MGEERGKEKVRGPQWGVIAAFVIAAVVLYLWAGFGSVETVAREPITYSQFLEKLEEGEILSVTIKEYALEGEFKEELTLKVTETGAERPVKRFTTQLPAFQGEGLIPRLSEKGVEINVAPSAGQSFFWQFLIVALPWIIIIGIWLLIMRRTTRI